jgi:hypothetical protein
MDETDLQRLYREDAALLGQIGWVLLLVHECLNNTLPRRGKPDG